MAGPQEFVVPFKFTAHDYAAMRSAIDEGAGARLTEIMSPDAARTLSAMLLTAMATIKIGVPGMEVIHDGTPYKVGTSLHGGPIVGPIVGLLPIVDEGQEPGETLLLLGDDVADITNNDGDVLLWLMVDSTGIAPVVVEDEAFGPDLEVEDDGPLPSDDSPPD